MEEEEKAEPEVKEAEPEVKEADKLEAVASEVSQPINEAMEFDEELAEGTYEGLARPVPISSTDSL